MVFPVSGDVLLGVALPLETLELPDGVAPEAVASEVVALEVVVLALPVATFAEPYSVATCRNLAGRDKAKDKGKQ